MLFLARYKMATLCRLLILLCLGVIAVHARAEESIELCSRSRLLQQAHVRGLSPALLPQQTSPSDTDVLHYSLSLTVQPPDSYLTGKNVMTIRSLRNDLNEFRFQLADSFTITTLQLDGCPISFTRINPVTVQAEFDRAYRAEETFELTVGYEGFTRTEGFGSIVFGVRSSGAPYAYTLSEPWFSYTWWPCKDDNTDKATADITVTVPEGLVVASNGLLRSVESTGQGQTRYHWVHRYPVAPYLISFAATNYNTWTVNFEHANGTMPVQFFIFPEDDTAEHRAAWEKCVDMLSVFSRIFGTYPFIEEKYGIYQFGFQGGMEHQTMTGQGGFWEGVTAHELAHQWWGDMVTCKTWHDIWLNEGFATYSQALWAENKPGSSGFPALRSTMQLLKPSRVDGSVYCYDISDIGRIFSSSFSYRKAAWVLHQLRHVVGDAPFFAILHEYRNRYRYDSASTEDFIAVAESVYGKSLRWFFDEWVYGIGAPAYRWGWANRQVNGKNYLLLSVEQTQPDTYGVFTMPIDIRATCNGQSWTRAIWNDARTEYYVLPIPAPTSSVALDEGGWILATEIQNAPYVPGPPVVVDTAPTPGARVSYGLDQLRVTFHTEVIVSASDFEVRGQRQGVQPFIFQYDPATCTVTLRFLQPLPPDVYTLRVRDTVRAADSGLTLDGEVREAVLPSGDGQPGGDAVVYFSVTLQAHPSPPPPVGRRPRR
ncbi:Aminopeptidase N [bacterium HR16]|nr:Aminopeptidase N [bacterium HR16]